MKALSILILVICFTACSTKQQFNYPTTRTAPFDTILYAKKISDPYFWMSRKANETEMKEWVSTQGKLTQSILDSIPNGDKLAVELRLLLVMPIGMTNEGVENPVL